MSYDGPDLEAELIVALNELGSLTLTSGFYMVQGGLAGSTWYFHLRRRCSRCPGDCRVVPHESAGECPDMFVRKRHPVVFTVRHADLDEAKAMFRAKWEALGR